MFTWARQSGEAPATSRPLRTGVDWGGLCSTAAGSGRLLPRPLRGAAGRTWPFRVMRCGLRWSLGPWLCPRISMSGLTTALLKLPRGLCAPMASSARLCSPVAPGTAGAPGGCTGARDTQKPCRPLVIASCRFRRDAQMQARISQAPELPLLRPPIRSLPVPAAHTQAPLLLFRSSCFGPESQVIFLSPFSLQPPGSGRDRPWACHFPWVTHASM